MKFVLSRVAVCAICLLAFAVAVMPSPAYSDLAPTSLTFDAAASVRPNDPDLQDQWALGAVNAFEAWGKAKTEGAVTVAVLDNGFLVEHEDLKDNIVATYNAVTDSTDPKDVAPFSSGEHAWHGTHVCGIIAARANNAKGIAGVSYNANLLPIKVFMSSTEATSADIAKAYDFVMEHADEYNIKVINFSGGHAINGSDPQDDLVVQKIKQAYDAGILTVCAAGNGAEYGPYMSFPGDLSDVALNVISLKEGASAGAAPVRADDSNYNLRGQRTKDIAAPGNDIWSTALLGNRVDWYRDASGTSQAAPCVAGVAALVYAANTRASAADVSAILCQTATDLGAEGWDEEYGYGMVCASAAVQQALDRVDISKAEITLTPDSFKFDGTPKQPDVAVTLNGESLEAGVDYSVDYDDNVAVGTASAIVTGANGFHGTQIVPFAIERSGEWSRIAGKNRYATMAAISQQMSDPSTMSDWAVVATGENFPDALAASALAGFKKCPVILTKGTSLTDQAENELVDRHVSHVYIMGGKGAVSADVENAIKRLNGGIETIRIAGGTRTATAVEAMKVVQGLSDTVIVATGYNYADSLSMGPWSYSTVSPILLTGKNGKLDAATLEAIKPCGYSSYLILGGNKAVSDAVESQLEGIGLAPKTGAGRIAGSTRYETSKLIAEFSLANGLTVAKPAVATGTNFPDALAAAPLQGGVNGSVLLLVKDEKSASLDVVRDNRDSIVHGFVLGGANAISDELMERISAITAA